MDEVTFCYKTKKTKKKKNVEKAFSLDEYTQKLSSETSTDNQQNKISPSEFFSLEKMQETKKRKLIPKFDTDAICVKEQYFRKVWYSMFGVTYASWCSSLQEYYIDYNLLWKNIVEPELLARNAFSTWRTFPCKKIMTKLPKGFSSWNQVLQNGGVKDASTNQGNLTKKQKQSFWNDQCSCPCWKPLFSKLETENVDSSSSCICQKPTCICHEIVVDNSWEAKLKKLSKMMDLCPWNASNLQEEIKDIQDKITKNIYPSKSITHKEYILSKREAITVSKEAQEEEMQQDMIVQKCFDFFYNLEYEYTDDQHHTPKTGEALLEWFWKGKEEFLQVYRKHCPENRFKLLYLNWF